MRSLALAATGAVAIFGAIALGGSRSDLLRGIDGFAHSYAADADLWVGNRATTRRPFRSHLTTTSRASRAYPVWRA